MKRLLNITLLIFIGVIVSCSNDDDCAEKRKEIYDQYEDLIKKYEGDAARIELVRQERERALQRACN